MTVNVTHMGTHAVEVAAAMEVAAPLFRQVQADPVSAGEVDGELWDFLLAAKELVEWIEHCSE